jgi:hypothetical protein
MATATRNMPRKHHKSRRDESTTITPWTEPAGA